MKRIILFASGNGSNAENICRYFQNAPDVKVAALFCNNAHAKVFERLKPYQVPSHLLSRQQLNNEEEFGPLLNQYHPDLIVLAGFLWLIPAWMVQTYHGRIINLHPALLPRYGGKGMHGHHVHEAVRASGEIETGITVHFVNEHFDKGEIIFQASVSVQPDDSAADIAAKISKLEMEHFPRVIEKVLQSA